VFLRRNKQTEYLLRALGKTTVDVSNSKLFRSTFRQVVSLLLNEDDNDDESTERK